MPFGRMVSPSPLAWLICSCDSPTAWMRSAPRKVRPREVCLGEVRPDQDRPAEDRSAENCLAQVRLVEVRSSRLVPLRSGLILGGPFATGSRSQCPRRYGLLSKSMWRSGPPAAGLVLVVFPVLAAVPEEVWARFSPQPIGGGGRTPSAPEAA